MAKAHPLTGVGSGNYPIVYPQYAVPGPSYFLRTHANNLYLNVLAELGVIGIALLLTLFVVLARTCVSPPACKSQGSVGAHPSLSRGRRACARPRRNDPLVYPVYGVPLFALAGAALRVTSARTDRAWEALPFTPRWRIAIVALFALLTPIARLSDSEPRRPSSTRPALRLPRCRSPVRRCVWHTYESSVRAEYAGTLEFKNGDFERAAQRLRSPSHIRVLQPALWRATRV